MKKIILFFVLLVLIGGCAKETEQQKEEQTQIANPASVYCEEQGGALRIVDGEGGQYGICTLPDGTECEEWAYYRGECPEAENESIEKGDAVKTVEKTPSTNPIDELSDETIQKWKANCKDKNTDLEKANCILEWQEKNLFWCYTHPEITTMPDCFEKGYPDCVVDMQFQQMSAGSFPVSRVMDIKLRDGKIFGACYTYAVTYCAIARWNGLECRVMSAKIITPLKYPASKGDFAAGYCGSAPKDFLDKLGLDCYEWRKLDWTIYDDHYWAEVLIDGEWKIMEKPLWAYKRDTQKNIIDEGRSYGDTGW